MSEAVEKQERDEVSHKFLPFQAPTIRAERFKQYISAIRHNDTCLTYMSAVRRFEKFLKSKDIVLKDASPNLLEDFVAWLSEQKLSPATVRTTYAAIKSYTKWCRSHGELECAEFAQPQMPRAEEKQPFVLTTDQLSIYFREVAKLREPSRSALLMLPYCGLRVTEMCHLKLKNLSQEKDERGKVWIVFTLYGKGRKLRSCPLFESAKPVLSSYLVKWRKKQPISPWLFPAFARGKDKTIVSLSAKTLRFHLRNIRERMGLPEELTPHALRRTCFTYLYRKGVPIETIAKIAGHASVDTTLKYYIFSSTKDILNKLGGAERKNNG